MQLILKLIKKWLELSSCEALPFSKNEAMKEILKRG